LFDGFVIISGDFADYDEMQDFLNSLMAGICVLCAGLAAGLTMGLLSMDATKLEIKCRVGTEEEKRDANLVLPIVKQHHLLLVTLLLFNSIANETLPIFLGELVPNYVAILLAVFLILIFGEILPSAFFTGVHQLRTSARLVPFVYCLMAVLYPIAYPISRALDKAFGDDEEPLTMTRMELEALVLMQQAHRLNTDQQLAEKKHKQKHKNSAGGPSASPSHSSPAMAKRPNPNLPEVPSRAAPSTVTFLAVEEGGVVAYAADLASSSNDDSFRSSPMNEYTDDGLSSSEVNLMLGVLNLSKHTVGVAMIPFEKVYMISSSNRLDDMACLQDIMLSGFSRIPVYYRNSKRLLMGYMLVKELIVVSSSCILFYLTEDGIDMLLSLSSQCEKENLVENINLREPLFVKPEVGLLEMLGIFQEGQCHMAIVTHDPTCAADHLRRLEEPPAHACILGIVTLEDVLEKVIQGDITDETDTSGYISALPRGVVTSSLSRKMGRSHTMGELFAGVEDSLTAGGSERRMSRGRARGHSASRNNLLALNSINVVAGDVRHKERDATSPSSRSRTPRGRNSGGQGDFFRDVVDTVVDDNPDSETEEFVRVEPTEATHLVANTTSKNHSHSRKPRYS